MKAAVAVTAAMLMLSCSIARSADPQKTKPATVNAGECNVRLTQKELAMYKPKGQGLLVWVGPCANGFAHGSGIVLQQRKDPENGVTYRYALRYTAVEGVLTVFRRPIYSAAPGVVWIDDVNSKQRARIKSSEVPSWAKYVVGKGELTFAEVQAAREHLSQQLRAAAPKPGEIVEAGGCRMVFNRNAQTLEHKWRGPCDASGFAHGPGYLEAYRQGGGRTISKMVTNMGRIMSGWETYDITPERKIMVFSGKRWFHVVTDQAPQWAREFLLAAPVVATAPPPTQIPTPMPSRPTEDTAAAERAAAEREARFQAALRENERDDREAERQADAEREEQSQQWMNTMGALAQQGQALKRQRDEQNARRQAERYRIERDNARYRQMRADEDRRWAEQNQRQQQAALDRQRAEQENERQRREQAMAQQRQAQAADYQRQQAEALRRQQEQQRALAEVRTRQQLAEASIPRVESFFRNNLYYLRNNGTRRVLCQVSAMMASSGIGAQPGLQPYQKAVTIWPNSEEAPFSGPVGNPRFFGCTVM